MPGKDSAEKVSEIDTHVAKQYDIIRRLGKGAYGIVWKAVDKKTKETVAVKKIFDAFQNQTDAQRTFREIMFLLSFSNHQNIIRLIGLHKANNDRDIYLIFEYMETDLHNVIRKGNKLREIHKAYIMYQLFKAIKYIHSGKVIHRDLKPSNVLLNTQCHCKIADFGLARSIMQLGEGEGDTGNDATLTDYVATRWYRAPEILIASRRYTKGIDMWSLGCILGEMMLGEPLFPGSSTINQVERIMVTLPPPTEEDLLSVSAGYGTNLLEKMPAGPRKTLRDMLKNAPEKALNLVCRLIVFNPTRRLTATQALEHPYVANFHSRRNEPERGSNVIPLLSDDVQLSVDEYRNKLYSMMDETHQKHRNMNKWRIRRLSEHIRKETTSAGSKRAIIVGQAGDVVGKNLRYSCGDVARVRSGNDFHNLRQFDGRGANGRNPSVPFHGDGSGHCNKKRTINASTETSVQGEIRHTRLNGKNNVATQYICNMANSNNRNIPPTAAKSCLYLSQQHRYSKSQRSIQSDQIIASSSINRIRPKLRRNCKQRLTPVIPAAKENPERRASLPKQFELNPADAKIKYLTRMPNITKRFSSTNNSNNNNISNSTSNSSDLCRMRSHDQVIHEYLNQTLFLLNKQRLQERIDLSKHSEQKIPRKSDNVGKTNYITPDKYQLPKKNLQNNEEVRFSYIETPESKKKKSTGSDGAKFFTSYNQTHGVITASAYKELFTGNFRC
ncbi:mitogen-activated protein kinase 15 [Prorops nasuta]|uniref:mitogen-activated protein kinase 15 n=1 Tax=Prorops nasuta TaxID=863751 RepID=UPI0034CE93C9